MFVISLKLKYQKKTTRFTKNRFLFVIRGTRQDNRLTTEHPLTRS